MYTLMDLMLSKFTKAEVYRNCMGCDNGRQHCGHDNESGDTWMLTCALGKSTGSRLAVRQANTPGFHANV